MGGPIRELLAPGNFILGGAKEAESGRANGELGPRGDFAGPKKNPTKPGAWGKYTKFGDCRLKGKKLPQKK